MLVRPNKTLVRGRVRAIRPEPAGPGSEIDLEILENRSASNDDFLKPAPGTTLTLYSAEAPRATVGALVEVEASLHAGPFGQRTVVRRMAALPQKNSGKRTKPT